MSFAITPGVYTNIFAPVTLSKNKHPHQIWYIIPKSTYFKAKEDSFAFSVCCGYSKDPQWFFRAPKIYQYDIDKKIIEVLRSIFC